MLGNFLPYHLVVVFPSGLFSWRDDLSSSLEDVFSSLRSLVFEALAEGLLLLHSIVFPGHLLFYIHLKNIMSSPNNTQEKHADRYTLWS